MTSYIQASTNVVRRALESSIITQSEHAMGMMSRRHRETLTNFCLLLERFKLALQALLNEQVIVRDTIQSNWFQKTRTKCLAQDLNDQTLKKYCSNDNDLLRINKILPKESFVNKIQKNDLLFQANDQSVSILVIFKNLIDEVIEFFITILIRRQSQNYEVMLDVKNLFILISY